MKTRRGLGRGLDVLLSGSSPHQRSNRNHASTAYFELPVAALVQGQFQPRHSIKDDELEDLVQSIRQQGVLQPLLVRELTGAKVGSGMITHEIVAGERRWRAAKLAGLERLPVIVRELDDKAALAVALIENLQREDLNPIEIAESLYRLTQEFGMTHQEAAESVGRSRSSVTNLLRLLDLDNPTRELVETGQLEMGHARALLALDHERQAAAAKRAVAQGLSVRQVEELASDLLSTKTVAGSKAQTTIDTQTRWFQRQLANELGVKVAIRARKNGGHTLGVDFDDLTQLQTTLARIEKLIDQVTQTAGPRVRHM